jgi:CMP-N,N'-diacetyllegionaminic acid synthase
MNIALIPAKNHSRRIPGKNTMDFCGKPLVQWTIEQAQNSKLIDTVVLSTDKDILYYGGEYDILLRPESLCTQFTTQEEVIKHAIENLKLVGNDNIILLQPTSPLRLPSDIDNAIRLTDVSNVASVTLDREPFLFMDGARVVFPPCFRENGAIYVISVGRFKNSRYTDYTEIYVMENWQQFEIDEPEDIEIAEYFMKSKILKEK